jgi:hypothetical protein
LIEPFTVILWKGRRFVNVVGDIDVECLTKLHAKRLLVLDHISALHGLVVLVRWDLIEVLVFSDDK